MISFKEYLLVEALIKNRIEFFLDPTKEELTQAKPWARGIAFPSGSFILAKNTSSPNFHAPLLMAMRDAADKGKMEKPHGSNSDVVEVQRVENSNLFAFGETLPSSVKWKNHAKPILKAVRKKSPHIRFSLNNILTFDVPEAVSGWVGQVFVRKKLAAQEDAK